MDGPSYAKNGWRYDNKVTSMMIEDMMFDPVLAVKVLLDMKVPPHQELRIHQMWTRHLTMDDSGFSTGKSITHAMVAALRCMLFTNRTVAFLSGTFRQGQLIFKYYDQWANSSKIFRSCLKKNRGEVRLTHGNSLWEAVFRGNNEIRVLPPDLLQDSNRLRSERWSDVHVDEWVTFGNFGAITKTIFGRVTKVNKYQSCPVRKNHAHLSSTPEYVHSDSYSLVREIDKVIESGDEEYARYTSNYRHVPRTKHYQKIGLIDYRTIFTMQKMNPPGVVESEIDGRWQADSQSFYLSDVIDQTRSKNAIPVLEKYPGDTYLGGFDTARGDNQNKKGTNDDFAFTVLRVPQGTIRPSHCLTIRKNNVTAENMSAMIHEIQRLLGISILTYDPLGGGIFVVDELAKPSQKIRNEETKVMPIIRMDSGVHSLGYKILVPFSRSAEPISDLWGKMPSESVLVNRMHTNFNNAISNNLISLAPAFDWTKTAARHGGVSAKREFLNSKQALKMSRMNRIKAEMDLAVSQLILVDVERKGDKSPVIDSFGMYKFKSKEKKDSAYSLCYSYISYLIWLQKQMKAEPKKDQPGFSFNISNLYD